MAEEIKKQQKSHEYEPSVGTEGAVETKDRGMLDFLGKKEEEKPQHHDQGVIATEFEKVHVSEPQPKVEEHRKEEKEEEKKLGFLDKHSYKESWVLHFSQAYTISIPVDDFLLHSFCYSHGPSCSLHPHKLFFPQTADF